MKFCIAYILLHYLFVLRNILSSSYAVLVITAFSRMLVIWKYSL